MYIPRYYTLTFKVQYNVRVLFPYINFSFYILISTQGPEPYYSESNWSSRYFSFKYINSKGLNSIKIIKFSFINSLSCILAHSHWTLGRYLKIIRFIIDIDS